MQSTIVAAFTSNIDLDIKNIKILIIIIYLIYRKSARVFL